MAATAAAAVVTFSRERKMNTLIKRSPKFRSRKWRAFRSHQDGSGSAWRSCKTHKKTQSGWQLKVVQ